MQKLLDLLSSFGIVGIYQEFQTSSVFLISHLW